MKYRSQAPCAEWADTLTRTLRPHELSASECAAFQEHMAACAACATTFADYQDLVTRLRALPRPAGSSQVFPELFVVQGSQKREHNLNESDVIEEQKEQGTGDPELPIPMFQPRKKPWQRRAMALAAILLVGALIGTFALAATRSVQIGPGSGASVFKLAHGWTQVALYRGTGSQTITVKNLQMPQLWGYSYACQGSGSLAIKLTGHASTIDTGTNKCDSTFATAPMALYLNLSTTSLQKIQVTADASTVWYLQLAEEETRSALPLDTSVWVSGIGIGGSAGSGVSMADVSPFYNNAGQQFAPKVWGVLLVCVGTGHGVFQVSKNVDSFNFADADTISFPVCNGRPDLSLVRDPTASQAQEVRAMVSGNMVWISLLLGCTSTDVAACK